MPTVRSRDGTTIGFDRTGSGPGLVLVHGGGADRTRFAPVLPAFEAERTVMNVDRRGRGLSGDSDGYALDREVDDLAAVCAAAAPPVDVFAHSFGAIVALEAARRGGLRRLVLYEPPVGVPAGPPGTLDRLRALLASGDREGVVALTFTAVIGVPEAALARLRAQPPWAGRVAAAHTLVRELEVAQVYRPDPALAALSTPILLLVGETSAPAVRAATERVARRISSARVEVLAGQGHMAIDVAPAAVARAVLAFLA
jgi:pimeloyl-ACP methyl ester carboxylesterase